MQKGRSGVRLDFYQDDNPLIIRIGPFVQHILHPSKGVLLSILVFTVATVGVNLVPFFGRMIPFWLGLVISLYFAFVTPMIFGSIDGFVARWDGSFPDDDEIKSVGDFVDEFMNAAFDT